MKRQVTGAILICLLAITTFSVSVFAFHEAHITDDYTTVDSDDVKMDSSVRTFEMGSREVRADLTIDLYNLSEATKPVDVIDSRRKVKLELHDVPEDWDIAVWDRFFDIKINEIVLDPPIVRDTPSQSLRLRINFFSSIICDGLMPMSIELIVLLKYSLFLSTISAL